MNRLLISRHLRLPVLTKPNACIPPKITQFLIEESVLTKPEIQRHILLYQLPLLSLMTKEHSKEYTRYRDKDPNPYSRE